jgi:membrane protease YdiL (CAAX protease family)
MVAFPIIVGLLMAVGDTGFWDALMLGVLLELLPVVAVVQLPLIETVEVERSEIYRGSMVATGVLAAAALVLGLRRGGPAALGLDGAPELRHLVWGVCAAMALLAVLLAWAEGRRRAGLEEEPIVRELMPRDRRERWGFVGLSIAAGVGEEIVYRGYAIPVLAAITGEVWIAVLLSSGAFGLVHVYQGGVGIARTGCIGLLLALTFLATGSLWPAIFAHALVDVAVGLWLADRLLA